MANNTRNQRELNLVNAHEAGNVQRAVGDWLVSGTGILFSYEYLDAMQGYCISTVQAAHITRTDILGGYEAQYQFMVLLRTTPENNDERIQADEDLNNIAEWMRENSPVPLPEGLHFRKLRQDTNAALIARYDNGAEDHSINFTLFYEVNV